MYLPMELALMRQSEEKGEGNQYRHADISHVVMVKYSTYRWAVFLYSCQMRQNEVNHVEIRPF